MMYLIDRIVPKRRARVDAFTLVELLVVITIFLLLTAVALPTTKKLLKDQKNTQAAQSVESFIQVARGRAISEGRTAGVRFVRSGVSDVQRSIGLEVRQLVGVPPYVGDSADASMTLGASGAVVNRATFNVTDSPLLLLASTLLNDGDSTNDLQSPIKVGDLLELPGGRTVPITGISGTGPVTVSFNLLEPNLAAVNRFPGGNRALINTAGDVVRYRIHRSPVESRSKNILVSRGLGVDFNYSGVGASGTQFAPDTAGNAAGSVDILFNSDGGISEVAIGGTRFAPSGLIFLCVGETDGIADIDDNTGDEDAFSQTRSLTTNINRLESMWIVINPFSGQVTSVANGSIATALSAVTAGADFTDPSSADFQAVISASRYFAFFSDTAQQ